MKADEFWQLGKGPIEPHQLDGWTVPRIFNTRAKQHPDEALYRVSDGEGFRTTTWGDLREQAALIAAGLQKLGIERGDRIAVMGSPCPEWVAIDFAVAAVGAITVGIYPTSSVEEIIEQVDHVGVKAMIILDHLQAEQIVPAMQGRKTLQSIIWDGTVAGKRMTIPFGTFYADAKAFCDDPGALFDRLAEGGSIDDPMRLFFTSGSTGKSKAVIHTQRSLLLGTDAIIIRNPAMRLVPQRIVAFQPMSHIVAVFNNILIPLITTTVPYFLAENEEITDLVRRVRPTYLPLMPRQYQKLAAQVSEWTHQYTGERERIYREAFAIGHDVVMRRWAGEPIPPDLSAAHLRAQEVVFRPILEKLGLDAVTRAQTTSAAMPREVAVLWCIYGLDLREGYGSSEAPVIAAQLDPFPEPGTVGRALPRDWFQLKLADDGEVLIKSPTLFSGYWQDPENSAAAFEDGWYKIGDIGEFDARGNLRLVGRKKDVIITAGGKTLNPADIEAPVRDSPYISEIIAVGEARKYVTALIELAPDAIASWLARQGKPQPSSYEDLVTSDEVKALIADEVAAANHKLSRVAQVKQFRILPRPLQVDEGELTATRKVRRAVVLKNFADLVETMYDSSEQDAISRQLGLLKSEGSNAGKPAI